MKTTAERCIEFLQSRGTTRNWQPVVMYNYGGRFLSYEGGPDWTIHKTIHKYRFDDGSTIKIRCSYKTDQQTVEFLIKNTVCCSVCSCSYTKF